ncbi:MAG: CheR family methyltransferase [Gemmatimonadota bacterium]
MTMKLQYPSLELSPDEFGRISATMQAVAGIRLPPGKETLVKSRLSKRLRALGLPDFDAYLRRVEEDGGGELRHMVDALTTNKTSFFREPAHFDHLTGEALPALGGAAPLRIWSAGCSTGEEPYTLAMVLREHDPKRDDARILGTDISTRALALARQGEYAEPVLAGVPAPLRDRYFEVAGPGRFRAGGGLRSLVSFGRLNLMSEWPMRGPFDVIFCRNVMIYFDRDVRERLVARFHGLLREGGYLYVGHSESLTGLDHMFRYVRPAVYRR